MTVMVVTMYVTVICVCDGDGDDNTFVSRQTDPMRLRQFYRHWALKESYIKVLAANHNA